MFVELFQWSFIEYLQRWSMINVDIFLGAIMDCIFGSTVAFSAESADCRQCRALMGRVSAVSTRKLKVVHEVHVLCVMIVTFRLADSVCAFKTLTVVSCCAASRRQVQLEVVRDSRQPLPCRKASLCGLHLLLGGSGCAGAAVH